MKTVSSAGPRSGNFYGLGTYLGLAGALLAMVVLFSVLSSHFLSYNTFSTLANQIPDLMVLAVGMTFVLIIGGIDLSVGSVLALAASTVSVAWRPPRWRGPSPVRSPWPGAFLRSSCLWACWKWPAAWRTR
jgi:ribose transport system permease protein